MKIFEFLIRDRNRKSRIYKLEILALTLEDAKKLADKEIEKLNFQDRMCIYNLKRERVMEKDIKDPILLNCYME